MQERKKLYNELQEIKGNIRVICRIRPLFENETENCLSQFDDNQLKIVNKKIEKTNVFEFDKVCNDQINQKQFFKEVEPLIISVLDGFNICIFSYGQTGSGKTYTMEGPPNNRGIVKDRKKTYSYRIQISLLEIYNENIYDLLAENQCRKKLEIKQSAQGNYVANLQFIEVQSKEKVTELLELGIKTRAIGQTNFNEHSSRSHLVYTIHISGQSFLDKQVFTGKLNLIDLAGSERLSKTLTIGESQKESISINKSLSALGDVINARINKNTHIPFRNSTLTYLLQESLSGDAKTLMILQVSPNSDSLNETISSLKFGSRIRSIELGQAKKNIQKKKLM